MTFKYAYQLEKLTSTFDDARINILTLDEPYRSAALQLLEGGMRYCELWTFDGDRVIGKGGKPRKIFLSEELKAFRYRGSYSALFVRLKAVGLKPHSLRKLWATRISRDSRIKDQDICKLGGWSSIETSIKYRQPHDDAYLKDLLQDVMAGVKKDPAGDAKKMFAKIMMEMMT